MINDKYNNMDENNKKEWDSQMQNNLKPDWQYERQKWNKLQNKNLKIMRDIQDENCMQELIGKSRNRHEIVRNSTNTDRHHAG